MGKNKREPTITGKVVAFLVALVLISNATVGIISYRLHREQSIASRAVEAQRIAITMAQSIDGDHFEEIMHTLEKDEYWYEVTAYADRLAQELGTAYLYIVDEDNDNEVVYFTEGTLLVPFDLGATESVDIYAPEMFEALKTGQATLTKPYPSGEYGDMVSGFAPIFNSQGKVAGVVGVDFYFDDLLVEVNSFGLSILGIVAAFLIIFFVIATAIGKKFVGNPLSELDAAAKQLARGDMDINVDIRTKSEIGRLSNSFHLMVDGMKTQISALEAVSQGDLTVNIKPRGEKDTMGRAIVHIINNLNEMFGEIRRSAAQVSTGSHQIADGAQILAQGATEQTASVEELSATIAELRQKTKNNTLNSNKAKESNNTAGRFLTESMGFMEKTLESMRGIDESSHKITKIIKVIDDIAFQTNILALNASVEAARAGQHGKGFAVVAEEVRNLAAKSAAAASETSELIQESSLKVTEGMQAVELTSNSLTSVTKHAQETIGLVSEVATASSEQETAIEELNIGIEQVSQVVQQNSATAEQSAAASEEMSGQSAMLHELVGRFKIK